MKHLSCFEFYKLECAERDRRVSMGGLSKPRVLEEGEYAIEEDDGTCTYAIVTYDKWNDCRVLRLNQEEMDERGREQIAQAQLDANLVWEPGDDEE